MLQSLCHIGQDLEWVDDSGEDLSEYLGGTESDLPNGVYIWEGVVVTHGGYDCEGIYDYDLELDGEFRLATREEWLDHVNEEYPWDPNLWFSDEMIELTDTAPASDPFGIGD